MTKQLYLVAIASDGLSEELLRLVWAEDEDTEERYIQEVLIRDPDFLAFLYSTRLADSFLAAFWHDERGPFWDERMGQMRVSLDYAKARSLENVRRFFDEFEEYADLYLAFCAAHKPGLSWREAMRRWPFPDEMLSICLDAAPAHFLQDLEATPLARVPVLGTP